MGRVLALLFAFQSVLLLSSVVSATPVDDSLRARQTSSCSTIRVRKEWRDMTVEQRLDYIRAVKCLQSTPSSSTRAGVVTRFDEFQAAHVDLTPQIHQVGQFLPWHRHYLTLYDKALREECAYNGPAAFWDWSRDADSLNLMSDSPVFDVTTGFGGNGVPGTYTPPSPQPQPDWVGLPPSGLGATGCVQTGPFKDMVVHLGPGDIVDAHCLVRGINEIIKPTLTSSAVNLLYLIPEFERFRQQLENGLLALSVHNGGHGLVGGEMSNVFSSPGDPLFYLHHGNLDRIWWKWQNAKPSTRMYAISGNTNSSSPSSPQLTLDYQMPFTTLSTPVRVENVMDTNSAPWCFTYDY
ncbi:hypothetical protein BKA70DRAFT_1385955 [Coprinopsis sp. MPI-PUGE-AT-0042]|nr:hypothetical protein BKA70DRAFT_1385955 [Coprinopsis sp. MPI-PUGE-AT-0042]